VAREISFGTHLRQARQKQKLRVRDVAAQMDISDAAIYSWEIGRNRPSRAHLITLCEILKLSLKATRAMANGA
jgi:transcriptional regulator with XRE-family HTH domain